MATGDLRTVVPWARHGRDRPGPRDQVELDAELREGVPARWAWQIFFLPITGLACLGVLFAVSRPGFYWLTEEDRPLEWLQFALCLFTSLVAVGAAWQYARRGRPGAAVVLLLLAFGMFVLAGEEISWAQRVIGEQTPASLAAVNMQAETNLHNVEVGFPIDDAFKVGEFVICVGGMLLSPLVRWRPAAVRSALPRLLAPPLFTVPLFAAMAAYQAAQYLVIPDAWDAVARIQEWAEVCMYLGLAALALSASRQQPSPPSGQRGSAPRREVPTPLVVAGLVLLVTAVCAVLSALSGVVPGNV